MTLTLRIIKSGKCVWCGAARYKAFINLSHSFAQFVSDCLIDVYGNCYLIFKHRQLYGVIRSEYSMLATFPLCNSLKSYMFVIKYSWDFQTNAKGDTL